MMTGIGLYLLAIIGLAGLAFWVEAEGCKNKER